MQVPKQDIGETRTNAPEVAEPLETKGSQQRTPEGQVAPKTTPELAAQLAAAFLSKTPLAKLFPQRTCMISLHTGEEEWQFSRRRFNGQNHALTTGRRLISDLCSDSGDVVIVSPQMIILPRDVTPYLHQVLLVDVPCKCAKTVLFELLFEWNGWLVTGCRICGACELESDSLVTSWVRDTVAEHEDMGTWDYRKKVFVTQFSGCPEFPEERLNSPKWLTPGIKLPLSATGGQVCETMIADQWVRDLTREGVEPNPGPPKGAKRGQKGAPKKKAAPKARNVKPKPTKRMKTPKVKTKKRHVNHGNATLPMVQTSSSIRSTSATFASKSLIMIEDLVELIIRYAYTVQCPANEAEFGGSLTPVRLKICMMHYVLSRLRDAGCLRGEVGTNVNTILPPFPDNGIAPVALSLALAQIMPFTCKKTGYRVSHDFILQSTYLPDSMVNEGLSSTNGTNVSKAVANPICCLTITPNPNEYQATTSTTMTMIPARFMGQYDAVFEYLRSVFPCQEYHRVPLHAPDASAYGYIKGARCFNFHPSGHPAITQVLVRDTDDSYNAPYKEKLVAPYFDATYTGSQTVDLQQLTMLGYIHCAMDFKPAAGIHAAVKASRWKTLETFSPSLNVMQAEGLSDAIIASIQTFCSSKPQADAMYLVCWSAVLHAMRACLAFVNGVGQYAGTIGTVPFVPAMTGVPIPPAVAEYISCIGVGISGGALVVPVFNRVDMTTNSDCSWVRNLITGRGTAGGGMGLEGSTQIWAGVTGMQPGGVLMGTRSWDTTLLPAVAAGFTYPWTPIRLARDVLTNYRSIPALSNFMAPLSNGLGTIDVDAMVEYVTFDNQSDTPIVAGYFVARQVRIKKVYASAPISPADCARIAVHLMRKAHGFATESMYISPILYLDAPMLAYGRYMGMEGYSLLSARIAESKRLRSVTSVGGLTLVGADDNGGELLEHAKTISSGYFSGIAETVAGFRDTAVNTISNGVTYVLKSQEFREYMGRAAAKVLHAGVGAALARVATRHAALPYENHVRIQEV